MMWVAGKCAEQLV